MAFNELSPYNTDELEARLSTTFARRVDVQPVSARGAVTISWDDGWLEWYTNLLPMLRDEFPHQNHTFAYTPGLLDNPNGLYQTTAQAQELAAALPHCEIASHSQTHANMKNSTVPVRVAEYDDSKANLEAIFGVPVTSFVYPFGGVGQDDSTNRELYGRYDRVVSAGNPMAATPLDDRFGMFITPRLDEWQSSSHQRMLAEVRKAAAQPVIVNIYSHRAGTTTTLAELRELFTLCDTLGVPVINIRDAYPAGGILTNPGAEQGVLGWPGLGATGTGKVFDTVTVTPDTGMPGTQAFHLSSPTDPTGFIYASQYVPAVEGRSYTLSGRAKIAYVAGTGSYAKIRYQPMDLAGVNLGGTVASADAVASWTRLTAAGVMPAGTKQVRIDFILLNTQGEAWFDHLHFAPTSAGSLG
jgi:peptidoglycan/xylan/chitin deacetylase (PgdA/CDA1 family)